MTAAETLAAARAAGISVMLEGGDLELRAAGPPPPLLLEALVRHKADVVALLRSSTDSWMAEDWQAFFDERAGIAEFDGGLPRIRAEGRAFACCVSEWLSRNVLRVSAGCCVAREGGDLANEQLLRFGGESTGHNWLHSRCYPAWHPAGRAEAVAALAAMGLVPPADFPDDFGKTGDV